MPTMKKADGYLLYLTYIHQQTAAQATELQVELCASWIRCDNKWNWYQIRLSVRPLCWNLGAWASYQIRKFAGWACAGNAGNVSTPPLVSDPNMHHGTCEMHVPWCMPGSLNSCSLWSRWRGKGSRHSRRMRNPQFCVSGKRRMVRFVIHIWRH